MKLFAFGLGYSSLALLRRLGPRLDRASGTVRSQAKAAALQARGVVARVFDGEQADPAIDDDLAGADALLISVPPGPSGDPVLRHFSQKIAAAPGLCWVGYLSTIGVYGDRGGAWVTEADAPHPTSPRSVARLAAEQGWLDLGARARVPTVVLRLAGIYGPGQNALVNLAEGTARRVIKPGQVFNRIHVDDIASAIEASMQRPRAGAVYNLTDDEPSPPQDVVAHAAALLGVEPPPAVDIEAAGLSPMGRSFFDENKRASSALARGELGWAPRYPSYREGLAALLEAGDGRRVASPLSTRYLGITLAPPPRPSAACAFSRRLVEPAHPTPRDCPGSSASRKYASRPPILSRLDRLPPPRSSRSPESAEPTRARKSLGQPPGCFR